jgi:mannose-1-phosphate guanylyltransferase
VKAYLLAAGLGTRLRPLTDTKPKCLLRVGGEPLLGRWLRACRRFGIAEVLINTHHLATEVRRYVDGPGRSYAVNVRLFHEQKLLGSAGTVRAARDFVRGEESFFIIYADNVSEVDLRRMAAWHAAHSAIISVALFRSPQPERCGVAVIDDAGRVREFVEKPARPPSPWASAGIYIARAALFDRLDEAWDSLAPGHRMLDFGYDILPQLAGSGEIRGYQVEDLLMDIGTPESYAAANTRINGQAQHAELPPSAMAHATGEGVQVMDRIACYMQRVADLARSMDPEEIRQVSEILLAAMQEGRQVFLFGNGGSAATASHFAVDLGKGLQGPGGLRLKAHSLVDAIPTMTAWANDSDYSRIFAEQLINFVQPGDVAIAISGSGNSPNVLQGVEAAAARGALTIGLTGFQGGKLKGLVDVCIIVPSDNMQQIEDLHMVLAHVIYTEMRECLAATDASVGAGRADTPAFRIRPRGIAEA